MTKKYQKSIKSVVNQLNDNHRYDVEEYIKVRNRIDKVNEKTILNNIQSILIISRNTKRNFKDLTADDLQDIEDKLLSTPKIKHFKLNGEIKTKKTSENYIPSVIEMYMLHFKNFIKFLYYPDEYRRGARFRKKIPDPSCVEWIYCHSASTKQTGDVPADYIPKDDDIKLMLEVCDNLRDSAMVSLFYDAGLRNQEICNLNINSITMNQQGGEVILPIKSDGLKTGTRRVFILTAVPYLREFLNNHPYKDYPNAPLFYARSYRMNKLLIKKSKGILNPDDLEKLRLDITLVGKIIKKIGEKANIKCHVYPHLLRHASATNYARLGLNESEMRVRYGWSKISKMPSRYIHIANADMDDKILRLYGLKPKEEIKKEREVLAPLICPSCKHENSPTHIYCGVCRMPLTIDAITTEPDKIERDFKKLIKQNPDGMNKILNIIQEMIENEIDTTV